jgi:hypothetical protein
LPISARRVSSARKAHAVIVPVEQSVVFSAQAIV